MSLEARPVHQAIDRWEDLGLVTVELAQRLRDDVEMATQAGTARFTQYLLASTGAVVLLIAAGVFLDWAWPLMGEGVRSGFLAAAGMGVYVGGARIEWMRRWLPAALFMQIAGLALLLGAFLYAENAWSGGSSGVVTGALALAVPIVLAPLSFRRSAVMPAVHLCFSLAFLAVFLDRAAGLEGDAIVWVLDAVLLVAALGLVWVLRSDPAGERHPWALNAFVAAVYAGFILILLTGTGPLHLDNDTAYPLDAWLFMVAGLSLWGIHRAPPGLRRDWFGAQLAYAIAMWIPLGMWTAVEALDAPSEVALVMVGGVGVAGFVYAIRFRVRRVLSMSALAFIAAIWYWAVDRAGALGAVLALAVTAAVLFRISGKAQSWLGEAGSAD